MYVPDLALIDADDLEQKLRAIVRDEVASLSSPQGFLRIEQAADFLGVSKAALYKLTQQGKVPFHKLGSRVLFDPAELREHILSGKAAA